MKVTVYPGTATDMRSGEPFVDPHTSAAYILIELQNHAGWSCFGLSTGLWRTSPCATPAEAVKALVKLSGEIRISN